jgi:DNA-binding NarL/FixJ family response regulator
VPSPRVERPESVASVAIVEDQSDLREGLAALIGGFPGFTCAGAYGSMEDALRGIARTVPVIALVDLGLPGMSGIDGIREIRRRHPAVLAVVLTVHSDDGRIFEALCAGAAGYLLKSTPPARLLESLQEVVAGGSPMSPEIARRTIALFRQLRPSRGSEHEVTPHEIRLLQLLAAGHNYRSAAARLHVSVSTISFHMRNIYRKLEVHSKSEAVSKAIRHGII